MYEVLKDRFTASRSPSSRRAWIEIGEHSWRGHLSPVALLAEGVDRNWKSGPESYIPVRVALLAEGVDRNVEGLLSTDMRKTVALLAEGVDRNGKTRMRPLLLQRRPPRGGRG